MICSSFSYPNMFDVSRNRVNLYTDARSITNRVKLLMLTDPTELYMNPNFGVGLRKYMFTYNNDNVLSLIRDKLIEQLRLWEPAVVPEETKVTRGVEADNAQQLSTAEAGKNRLKITITLVTAYAEVISFGIDERDFENIV